MKTFKITYCPKLAQPTHGFYEANYHSTTVIDGADVKDACKRLHESHNIAHIVKVEALERCRYCDHWSNDHEPDSGPCNYKHGAYPAEGSWHCTCYGFNLDVPEGRGRALSARRVDNGM